MPIFTTDTGGYQTVSNKRRRNSSGHQRVGHKRSLQHNTRTEERRQSQTGGATTFLKKMSLNHYDLSAQGLAKDILTEALITECMLNNPGLEIFYSTSGKVHLLQFSDPVGDIFTVVNVLRQWSATMVSGHSRSWCLENHINEQTCSAIENYVKTRLSHIISYNDGAKSLTFNKNFKEACEGLYDLIVEEFGGHLCLYQGHSSLGYMSVLSGKTIKLRETSVVHFYRDYPQYIVTLDEPVSKDVPMSCMVISDSKARELYSKHSMGYDLCYTLKNHCVHPVIKNNLTHSLIHALEESWEKQSHSLQSSLKCALRELHTQSPFLFVKKHNAVYVYGLQEAHENIEKLLMAEIDILRNIYQKERGEISFPTDNSMLRVLVGPGCEGCDILYPDQYLCLSVEATETEKLTKDLIMSELQKYGDIETVIQNNDNKQAHGKWGVVKFKTAEDVEQVMKAKLSGCFLLEFTVDKTVEDTAKMTSDVIIDRSNIANVRICRRPCNRGKASVVVKGKRSYGRLLSSTLQINGKLATITASTKPDTLIINGCELTVDEASIMKAIRDTHGFSPEEVHIHRNQPFPASNKELDFFKYSLIRIMDKVTDVNKVSVKVTKPKPQDIYLHADIKFENSRIAISAMDNIKGMKLNRLPILVHEKCHVTSASVTVSQGVEKALHKDLQIIIGKVTKQTDVEVSNSIAKCGDHVYKITSEMFSSLEGTLERFQRILSPVIIPLSTRKYSRLTSKSGAVFLSQLQNSTECYTRIDTNNCILFIYGTKPNLTKAKQDLEDFLSGDAEYFSLDFLHESAGQSAMFDFVRDYGASLKSSEGVKIASFNIEQKQATLQGAHTDIVKVAKKYITENVIVGHCPSCYMDIEVTDEEPYTLNCGHQYCRQCMKQMLDVAFQDKQFPIFCVVEGCGKLSVHDIFQAASSTKYDFKAITNKVVDQFVQQNLKKWSYCPQPNCHGVIRKRPEDKHHRVCPACYVRQCLKCLSYYHTGSCDDHHNVIAFQNWMKADTGSRKICPSCDMAIEKIEGCNRVHCAFCKREICWVCLKHFPDSTACYNHLNEVHGGV